MLHLMRQTLADTAAASQDDRPAAGGDVDMVDQGAAAPDPQVPTGVSLSKAQNESLAKMAGERKRQLLQMKTADEMDKMQPPLKKAGTAAHTCARAAVRGAATAGAHAPSAASSPAACGRRRCAS